MTKDDLYNRIIKEYMKCGSVKQTAINAGITLVRAQRVLITEGLWRSDTSDAVCELYEQRKTTQEIADALYYSVKTVQAYLPSYFTMKEITLQGNLLTVDVFST